MKLVCIFTLFCIPDSSVFVFMTFAEIVLILGVVASYFKIQKKYKNKKVAKAVYFLTRTFPEYSYMCNIYPFLYKAPVLMPVMWIVRLICAPVTKMDRIRKEVGFWRKMGKKE